MNYFKLEKIANKAILIGMISALIVGIARLVLLYPSPGIAMILFGIGIMLCVNYKIKGLK